MSAGQGPILITGGAGFIGANLADRLAGMGHTVTILDVLARPGVERNLTWLKKRHGTRVNALVADIREEDTLRQAVHDAQAVFHLAAQVAVTTSLDQPFEDFDVNLRGTMLLLEAIRRTGRRIPVVFASTNKVYGDLADVALDLVDTAWLPRDPILRAQGIPAGRPLDFHTPYGCSKGAADQYVLDYSRSFGLPTCVLRMSCIYGPRQMGTEDQGWVAHFLIRALRGQPISIFGDGFQVRDVLYVGDAVDTYIAAWQRIDEVAGQAFNLGGGPANAVSLRQMLGFIEQLAGRRLQLSYDDWRSGDQQYYVCDNRPVREALGLGVPLDWRHGVARLADWLEREHGEVGPAKIAGAAA